MVIKIGMVHFNLKGYYFRILIMALRNNTNVIILNAIITACEASSGKDRSGSPQPLSGS
jgi:hypothetical protein